jgi:hypothetical protein
MGTLSWRRRCWSWSRTLVARLDLMRPESDVAVKVGVTSRINYGNVDLTPEHRTLESILDRSTMHDITN